MSFESPQRTAPPSPLPPPTSRLAVVSLLLGVAGFLVITIPVNLVVGVVALIDRNKKGKKLAAAGLVLSVAWAAGLSLLLVSALDSPEPKRDAKGRISQPGAAAPEKLKIGDCIAELKEGSQVTNVRALPCTQPNGGKVFAIFDLTGNWPGDKAVESQADRRCTAKYPKSRKQASGRIEFTSIQPTEQSWKLGDRRVICLLAPAS